MDSKVVTIDGPAASGKTSVSRNVANGHGWSWVSTGAFYRGLAYVASRAGCDLTERALSDLAASDLWEIRLGEDRTQVFFENEDVTEHIYKEEVGTAASQLSSFPEVRKAL